MTDFVKENRVIHESVYNGKLVDILSELQCIFHINCPHL
jgi:hypothetical protein